MSNKAEQLALLQKKLSMTKTKLGKAVLEKKIEKLKSEMGSSKNAKKEVTEAKKKVSQMSIAELKKKPEFSFLKGMNKGKIADDQKHVAKPKGWRFKGKGKYRKPTKAEIVAGKKRGNVYYEARNRRSDVSRIVRLGKGGGITNQYEGKYVNEVWNSWNQEQRIHFLDDHNAVDEKSIRKKTEKLYDLSEKKWKELPLDIISAIQRHVERGQYKKGGSMANGGGVGIDFSNFTIDEFESYVSSKSSFGVTEYNSGDVEVRVSEGNNVNKSRTGKEISKKSIKGLSFSIGDAGRNISVITGNENIYADIVVYDNNWDKGYKEYTISLFSKEDREGLKSIVSSIIEKFDNGGGVKGSTVKSNYVEVVLNEGSGKVINDLYNQWNNVKDDKQYVDWVKKVRETKFGTYGTISFEEILDRFNFDNAPINSFHLKTFKKELENALNKNKYATGGGISRSQKRYNKEVDAYKWFIVDLANKKAVSGWEFKSDGEDALSDYDGDKNFKLVAEKTLSLMGIENPKERFKMMATGGGVGRILNNYEGKSAKEVYEMWDYPQKYHFFKDHYQNRGVFDNQDYKNLPSTIKFEDLPLMAQQGVKEHVEYGQYTSGGSMATGGGVDSDFEHFKSWYEEISKKGAKIIDQRKTFLGGGTNNFGEALFSSSGDFPYLEIYPSNSEAEYFIAKLNKSKQMAKGGGVGSDKAIEELWNGYASAILFAETDLDRDDNLYISDFDEKTVSESKKMLRKFYSENKDAIGKSGLELFIIGNDIWYSRAGHGAGFFDHSLDKDIEEKLTKGAKALGEFPTVEIYDGKISVTGGRVFKYATGGGVRDYKGLSNSDKFISDQLYYVISVKSISEKKKIIKDSLLPNIDDYVTDKMTNKITKDNLKYALQQKTVASIDNVLRGTINAFRKTEYAKGGGVENEKSLRHFILEQVSSGMIANKIPYSDYKTIDEIKFTALQILNRDGDREYSMKSFSDLIQEALLEYEENKYENKFDNGGGVGDKKEMKLYRIETLAKGNKDVLTDRDDNLYIYEKGVLYDTEDGIKKGTSHRMSKINLTILPYKEYATGGSLSEPHRNEIMKSGGKVEQYPELRKIADKIADETAIKINNSVKTVSSKMPYKAQWVLEEVVIELESRI